MIDPEKACHVLLVDDHPLVCEGLRSAFRRLLPAARVGAAGSADEALVKMGECRPHLIVLDVNLPGMNGLELARRIRARDPEVRLLMLSGEADSWTVREAVAAGASGFVNKRCVADWLAEAVQTILGGGNFFLRGQPGGFGTGGAGRAPRG